LEGLPELWCFDFDGTLSELVPDRDTAVMEPACRQVLAGLAHRFPNRVAVISSRDLDDLIVRAAVPGVHLGGGSGLEWRTAHGESLEPGEEMTARLSSRRRAYLPLIREVASSPGVEVEDKGWSVALHFGAAPSGEGALDLSTRLEELKKHRELRLYAGPRSVEVQFLEEADKRLGMRRLCRIARVDPESGGPFFYAGDDENDAVAMRWILERGGIAVVVGNRIAVEGAFVVAGPRALAAAVGEMAGLSF
jgi:trehalose-phosphatase